MQRRGCRDLVLSTDEPLQVASNTTLSIRCNLQQQRILIFGGVDIGAGAALQVVRCSIVTLPSEFEAGVSFFRTDPQALLRLDECLMQLQCMVRLRPCFSPAAAVLGDAALGVRGRRLPQNQPAGAAAAAVLGVLPPLLFSCSCGAWCAAAHCPRRAVIRRSTQQCVPDK